MGGRRFVVSVSFIAAAMALSVPALLAPAASGAVGGSAFAQAKATGCAQVVLYELKGSAGNSKSASPGKGDQEPGD